MAKDGAKKAEELRQLADEWKASRETHRPYHKAIGIEYEYALKLKQHNGGDDQMKVVSLDVTDIVRYNRSEIAGTSIYLDVEADSPPEQPGADAQADQEQLAHAVRTALLRKVQSLDIGYPRVRRRVIGMACAARMGAAVLELVSHHGRIRVSPRIRDPRDFTWDARFPHFTDDGCQRLYDRQRLTYSEIERLAKEQGWDKKAVAALHPDNGMSLIEEPRNLSEADLEAWRTTHAEYTIVTCWDKSSEKVIEVSSSKKLDPQDYYFSCSKCGYTEKDLSPSEAYDGSRLGEFDPCPQCGMDPEGRPVSMMTRIETAVVRRPELAFENGYRRLIFAPFCPEAEYLLEAPWPRGLTNFPVMLHITDPYPIEPSGNSDTFMHMSMHGLKNFVYRETAEQFARNRDLTIVHEELATDGKGNPYPFDGTGPYVAFTEFDDVPNRIYHHQGSGMSPAAPALIGLVSRELMAFRGQDQMSLDPAALKGTPVGSMAMAQETGRVPLDERIRIWREDEEQFIQRWLEMLIGNSDEHEWVYAQKADGSREWRQVIWSALSGLTVRVLGKPRLDFVDQQNMSAMEKLAPLAQISPALFRTMAAASDLPSSTVEQILKDFAMAAVAANPAGGGAPAVIRGEGPGPAGPPAGELEAMQEVMPVMP